MGLVTLYVCLAAWLCAEGQTGAARIDSLLAGFGASASKISLGQRS